MVRKTIGTGEELPREKKEKPNKSEKKQASKPSSKPTVKKTRVNKVSNKAKKVFKKGPTKTSSLEPLTERELSELYKAKTPKGSFEDMAALEKSTFSFQKEEDLKKLNKEAPSEFSDPTKKKAAAEFVGKSDKSLEGRTEADAKVEDVSADPEKVSNVMALLKRNKESNEPSPEAADQIEPKEGKKKKKKKGFWEGIGDQFSGEKFGEALAYFTPDILGGVIGLALGGKTGALEGLKHANQVRLGMDEQRRKDKELNLKDYKAKTKAMQQSEWGYVDPVTGKLKPGVFDPNTGKLLDLNGIEVENPVNLKEGRQLNRQEFDVAKREDIRQSKEEDKIQEATASDAVMIKHIGALEDTLKQSGLSEAPLDITENTNEDLKSAVGIFNRYKTWGQSLTGFAHDPKYGEWVTKLNSQSKILFNTYIKALSGVAVNPEELKRASALIPNEADHWRVFIWKTKALKELYTLQKEAKEKHFSKDKRTKEMKKYVDSKRKEYKKLKLPSGGFRYTNVLKNEYNKLRKEEGAPKSQKTVDASKVSPGAKKILENIQKGNAPKK